MGIRNIIECDVTGAELPDDTKPERLTWHGTTYNLYLSDEGRERLTGFLEPILTGAATVTETAPATAPASAQKVKRKRRSPEEVAQAKQQAADKSAQLAEIRSWGSENGYTIKGKGRLPDGLKDAWVKATGQTLID